MKVQKTGRGKNGVADVRVLEKKIQIRFKGETDPISLSRADAPDYVRAGKFIVGLNQEMSEIVAFRPINAMVTCKFDRLVSKEDEPPAPIQKPAGTGHRKDGTTFPIKPYMAFMALLTITGPKEYAGMQIPLFLHYLFVDDGEGSTMLKGAGKNADLLEEFLESAGVLDDALPFTDNVLPKLQRRILAKGKEFMVILKGGWVDSFAELPVTEQGATEDDVAVPQDDGKEGIKVTEGDDEKDDGADLPWDEDDDV